MRYRKFSALAVSTGILVMTTTGGCSGTSMVVQTMKDAATDDGGTVIDSSASITDAGVVEPKTDASSFGDGGGCPGPPPTFADLEASGGWKPPGAVMVGACSAADITQFGNNFGAAKTYDDLKAGLPASCTACIFSVEASATWGFTVTDGTGQFGFFNYGACFARAQFGSDACGKAVQYSEFCINRSCSGCGSPSAASACQRDTATQQACSANFAAAIQAGCGTDQAKLKALDDACGKATLAANVLCGTGP
jgi:hypothetical protein